MPLGGKKRIEQKVGELFAQRYLFVQRRLSPSERATLQLMVQDQTGDQVRILSKSQHTTPLFAWAGCFPPFDPRVPVDPGTTTECLLTLNW